MSTHTNGGEQEPDARKFGYSFGILLLGLVGILGGVMVLNAVPPTVGGAIIAAGYALVYVGFLSSLYLDLRDGRDSFRNRPLDGESG